MTAILDSETGRIEQFWIPYRLDTSHQISAQSDFPFGRCRLKNFKMVAILDIDLRQNTLAILNLHVSPIPPTKFQLNLTFRSGDVI